MALMVVCVYAVRSHPVATLPCQPCPRALGPRAVVEQVACRMALRWECIVRQLPLLSLALLRTV
jgi:hypothetical protein